MQRSQLIAAALAAALGIAAPAASLTLSLDLGQASVPLGGILEVDIVVSGLGDFAAPSVGSFDLDIRFEDAFLGFVPDVDFGPFLGDVGALEAFTDSSQLGNVVDLAEVSLLLPSELDALQPDSFVLATLRFEALAQGPGALSFTQTDVGDAFGPPLVVDAAQGVVVPVSPAVPEPSGLVLFAAALVVFACARRAPLLPTSD